MSTDRVDDALDELRLLHEHSSANSPTFSPAVPALLRTHGRARRVDEGRRSSIRAGPGLPEPAVTPARWCFQTFPVGLQNYGVPRDWHDKQPSLNTKVAFLREAPQELGMDEAYPTAQADPG